jgi:hypothetical protein
MIHKIFLHFSADIITGLLPPQVNNVCRIYMYRIFLIIKKMNDILNNWDPYMYMHLSGSDGYMDSLIKKVMQYKQ